jgi:hypothetical protein
MSEARTITKMIIFMGILFLLIGLMYPGADAPWTAFKNTLGGQGYPTFNNPYQSVQLATVVQKPTANSNPSGIESTTGCTIALYFQCVAQNSNTKWLTLNASDNGLGSKLGGYFNVAMTNVTGQAVLSSSVTVWCRTNATSSNTGTTPIGLDNVRPGPTVVRNGIVSPTCNQGTEFLPLRFPVQLATGGFPVAISTWNNVSFLTGAGITLKLGVAAQKVQVSYVELNTQIDLGSSGPGGSGSCANWWDFGCQLSRLVDPLVKFFLFIGNGLIFFVQLIFWALTVMFTLGLGLIGTFAFMLALPGAPAIAQGAITALFIGCIAFILISFVIIARGSSTLGD